MCHVLPPPSPVVACMCDTVGSVVVVVVAVVVVVVAAVVVVVAVAVVVVVVVVVTSTHSVYQENTRWVNAIRSAAGADWARTKRRAAVRRVTPRALGS